MSNDKLFESTISQFLWVVCRRSLWGTGIPWSLPTSERCRLNRPHGWQSAGWFRPTRREPERAYHTNTASRVSSRRDAKRRCSFPECGRYNPYRGERNTYCDISGWMDDWTVRWRPSLSGNTHRRMRRSTGVLPLPSPQSARCPIPRRPRRHNWCTHYGRLPLPLFFLKTLQFLFLEKYSLIYLRKEIKIKILNLN